MESKLKDNYPSNKLNSDKKTLTHILNKRIVI